MSKFSKPLLFMLAGGAFIPVIHADPDSDKMELWHKESVVAYQRDFIDKYWKNDRKNQCSHGIAGHKFDATRGRPTHCEKNNRECKWGAISSLEVRINERVKEAKDKARKPLKEKREDLEKKIDRLNERLPHLPEQTERRKKLQAEIRTLVRSRDKLDEKMRGIKLPHDQEEHIKKVEYVKEDIWKHVVWAKVIPQSCGNPEFDRHGMGESLKLKSSSDWCVQILAEKNVGGCRTAKYLCALFHPTYGLLLGNIKQKNLKFDKESYNICPYVVDDAVSGKVMKYFAAPKIKGKNDPKPTNDGYDKDRVCAISDCDWGYCSWRIPRHNNRGNCNRSIRPCQWIDCDEIKKTLAEIFSCCDLKPLKKPMEKILEARRQIRDQKSKANKTRRNRRRQESDGFWDQFGVESSLSVAAWILGACIGLTMFGRVMRMCRPKQTSRWPC